MTYSVILPTLNEKNHIIQLIKAISEVFKRNKKKFEIIVVDDCSDDGTIEILNENKDKMSFLKVFIRKGKKRNLANSINDGIRNAIYENVIWMDADFQHNPEAINSYILIKLMIKPLMSLKVFFLIKYVDYFFLKI